MQGKLEIVRREMKQTGIELMGISELHWVGTGHFLSGDHKMFYSGNELQRKNEVAIV